MSDWISIEDELPKRNESVLVADWYGVHNYGMVKAYWRDCWFIDADYVDVYGDASIDIGFKPTHWMPLPNPPKLKSGE